MMHLIETSVARLGATIHEFGANLDYEVLSLPGGSLIALLMWLYGTAKHAGAADSGPAIPAAVLPAAAAEQPVAPGPQCLRSALCCAGKM